MKVIICILALCLLAGCATAPVFGPCTIAAKQAEASPTIKSMATVGDVLLYGTVLYYLDKRINDDDSAPSIPVNGDGTMINVNITGDRNDVRVYSDDDNSTSTD